MRKIFLPCFLVIISLATEAQENYWTAINESQAGANIFANRTRPTEFKLFKLQTNALQSSLATAPSERVVTASNSSFIITVPNADGQPEHYRAVNAPVMAPELAAKYPGINSYAGVCIENPSHTIRFSYSTQEGFHAMILSSERATIYISPVKNLDVYVVASRQSMFDFKREFQCLTTAIANHAPSNGQALRNADDARLRTYRLALAASGEFSQFWLEGDEPDDAARRAEVLAAQNVLMTRCNGIFERDFGARLVIVGNNDEVIFLDAGTDPWPGSGYNSQTQTTIDAEIGNGNYDIGHLLDRHNNNGNAGCIGCVCVNATKGRGFTSLSGSNWNDDLFVIDYLPHEMGHQMGGNHTFSHDNEGPTIAQVEPGSGSTIMGYAGITSFDVQNHSHDNFHAVSIQQITDYLKSVGCGTVSMTGNNTPTANAGGDFTIPKSTPFKLTGSGSDADGGDVLSFVWEQMDVANAFGVFPSTTQTAGPVFRCFSPTSSTSRTFPSLANILDGSNTNTWEKLPSVGRTLNFRFTVQDNHPGAGNNRSDDMVVTIDGATGPLKVTSFNSPTTVCPGARTITWDVNGSNAHAANVNILLSTDGGNTFPTVLAANTPNDGSQSVNIPCTFSTTARIKVEAVGNIFFDISDANFTAGDNTKPTFTVPANVVIFKDANCNYDASVGITGDVTDEADNCDNTLNATFADAVLDGVCEGELILTRTWTLTDDCLNSTVKVQTITIRDNTAPTFTAPADITIFKDANCNHDASVGVTGDVTDEADNCDNTLNATFTDVTVPGSCIGEEIITRTWTLTDDCGNSTSHNQVITVKDVTGPVFSGVGANPNVLWPPNHKMVDVTINYVSTDNCSPVTICSLSVTSNEPVNGGGDGNTFPDWLVVDDHHVKLRAERSGSGSGRVYTITITCRDDCGNVSTTTTTVSVPHDNSRLTNVEPVVTGLKVSVMPNPSSGDFRIYVESANFDSKLTMTVSDLQGRIIETRSVSNESFTTLGASYRPGVYMVRITQGSEQQSVKIVKVAN